VYEKGAEIIRMLKVLIGDEAFYKGMDLYFARYDGAAATIEDFIACFAEISGRDLTQFSRWYSQAGTPLLEVASSYDAEAKTFTLDFEQSCKPTPRQDKKEPFVIPIALGLIAPGVGDIPLHADGNDRASDAELASGIIELSGARRRVTFRDVPCRPVPSLLRGFSAPVRLDYAASEADLLTLIAHDSDSFNRWQAAQTYATRLLQQSVAKIRVGEAPHRDKDFSAALGTIIETNADPAFVAQAIGLPGETDIAREIGEDVDPDAVHFAHDALAEDIGKELREILLAAYRRLAPEEPYSPDAGPAGRRALRNAALALLARGDQNEGAALAMQQFESSGTMTGKYAALCVLTRIAGSEREDALQVFYKAYENEPLVIDKWFALQAAIPEHGTLARVKTLMHHKAFSYKNPNRLRALAGSFAAANPTQFNAGDGSGYDFITGLVLDLDAKNPQVAARLLSAFRSWRILEPRRRALAEKALQQAASAPSLSADVKDIAERSLAN